MIKKDCILKGLLSLEGHIKSALNSYTEYISSLSEVLEIYLFGSHVNGSPNEHSDIDLMVIVEDGLDPFKIAFKINKGLAERKIPLDILVNKKSDFYSAANENTFQRIIKNEGVLIYDAQISH